MIADDLRGTLAAAFSFANLFISILIRGALNGVSNKDEVLENVLEPHVDVVTLVTPHGVPQQCDEDRVREDLVNLVIVPDTERWD